MKKSILLFIIIILIAIFFRFLNINWDEGHNLHPDERFLNMVNYDSTFPKSWAEYFNQKTSKLNPRNINFTFFVYGNFPLILNKFLAVKLKSNNDFGKMALQGRTLAASLDVIVVIILFLFCLELENEYHFNKKIKYLASFFYAISVIPIQLSHFFTTDIFFHGFTFLSLYFALLFSNRKKWLLIIPCAIFYGLAVASKVSAIYSLPLLIALLGMAFSKDLFNRNNFLGNLFELSLTFLLFIILTYFTMRLADPYMFEYPSFAKAQISQKFIANIKELKNFETTTGEIWYPPAIQWLSKDKIAFPLINLALYGVGLVIFSYFLSGFMSIINLKPAYLFKNIKLKLFIGWMIVFFLYLGTRFSYALRYFISLYPFIALFAAIGFIRISKIVEQHWGEKFAKIISLVLLSLTVIWPMMFISIYLRDNSRVAASKWIYQHIPPKSIIISEHWDDGLPLSIRDKNSSLYEPLSLPIYNKDESAKWQIFNELLGQADYYILSSNRGWGSIPYAKQYPMMGKFYNDLFNEKLGFVKVAEFTSYPSLSYLGIPFELNDDKADETFTVYDHPKVLIFKNVHK